MGALQMGIPEEELPGIRDRWRAANKQIVALWYAVEAVALSVVETGRPARVRNIGFALEGDAATQQSFMTVALPSGRKLFYARPFLSADELGRPKLHYYGVDSKKKFGLLETYGGKLVENITQAVARDCLAESIERLEAAGWPVVFHVHDEVVIDCPRERADLQEVCRIMGEPIGWAPGLPLKADGWIGNFYTKD